MILKFLSRLIIKVMIILFAFIFFCGAAGIDPSQLIVQVKQGYNTIQEFKSITSNMSSGQDYQNFFNQIDNIK